MSIKVRTIRSLARTPQQILWKHQAIILNPGEERSFTPDIAEAFLEMCGKLVEEVTSFDIAGVYQDVRPTQTVWVANMTGDPDAKATIIRKKKDRHTGQFIPVEWPNINAEAIHIKREMKGAEVQYVDRHGVPASYIMAPTPIDLPAYQRREMPRDVARWFLGRDRMKAPYERGQVVICRGPTSFEPTMEWGLDEMRVYLRLCDPQAKLGPEEAEVRALATSSGALSPDLAVHDAKRLCMKRLHFRIVNLDVRLPTKKDFEHALLQAKPTAATATAIMSSHAAEKKTAQART